MATVIRRKGVDYNDAVYTGPGTIAGRWLRMFWQAVHVAEDLPRGRAVPIRIMGEDFTLYRGDSGEPHLVGFRCAHRGTQLSVGWVEGEDLRCFYHGWKYGPSGQCLEQPAEPKPFCEKIRIPSYPVREYIGLIFAYLGEGEPPLFPRFANFENSDEIIDVTVSYRFCNYTQNIENSVDNSHVPFVHREFANYSGTLWAEQDHRVEETDWGIASYTLQNGQVAGASHFGMPNTNYTFAFIMDPEFKRANIVDPRAETLLFKVPIDDDRHVRFGVHRIQLAGDAAERFRQRRQAQKEAQKASAGQERRLLQDLLSGKVHLNDIDHNRVDFIPLQDDVAQGGQGAIYDRTNEHLGRSDMSVIFLRQLYARELRKVAEGQPVKRWTYRPEYVPTSSRGSIRSR